MIHAIFWGKFISLQSVYDHNNNDLSYFMTVAQGYSTEISDQCYNELEQMS